MLPVLDPALCRLRQDRLRSLLAELRLDAAVFTNRSYVHALTGYWHPQPLTRVSVVVRLDGPTTLLAPQGSLPAPAADEQVDYVSQKLATLVENIDGNMLGVLYPLLQGLKSIGGGARGLREFGGECVDITIAYQHVRRTKDPDEVAMLRFAIDATEAAYATVKNLLPSRPTEVELHAAMCATVLREVGEPLSGWGNDFQSGSPGGLPRDRRIESGELAVYDVGVGVRGYRSDLCRTFAVDGLPTDFQSGAHARILEAFEYVEAELKPGLDCKTLYSEVRAMLDGWKGYAFPHHLGHGIGLDAHEVPRLNPEWDDVLRPGDVIAVEPALYGDDLRAGIRLEHNYLITESGSERLSSFPLDL